MPPFFAPGLSADSQSNGPLSAKKRPPHRHHPSQSLSKDHLLSIDTSLTSAISALVNHLTIPLAPHYPHSLIVLLRQSLNHVLFKAFESTWRPLDPSFGTGHRSLICSRSLGLPKLLIQSTKTLSNANKGEKERSIDPELWRKTLVGPKREDQSLEVRDEWEIWCDPGSVVLRYGSWTWYDEKFDPVPPVPESYITIWQAGPSGSTSDNEVNITPIRPSAAIPIKAPAPAPALNLLPPTPATSDPFITRTPTPLMPAADISFTPGHSKSSSISSIRSPTPSSTDEEDFKPHVKASTYPSNVNRSNYRISSDSSSSSTSSISSEVSDSNTGTTQLLTPASSASRPASVDPFSPNDDQEKEQDKTPTPGNTFRGRDASKTFQRSKSQPHPHNTPIIAQLDNNGTPRSITPAAGITVTPYDGGNVTVLGGGIKLGGGGGGGSRPGSVVSQHRHQMDRTRSPSVSSASRALNSALSPGEVGSTPSSTSTGSGRKPRTRRRIMPTYLGYVGQPGVAPVGSAFQPMLIKSGLTPIQQGQVANIAMNYGMDGVRQPVARSVSG